MTLAVVSDPGKSLDRRKVAGTCPLQAGRNLYILIRRHRQRTRIYQRQPIRRAAVMNHHQLLQIAVIRHIIAVIEIQHAGKLHRRIVRQSGLEDPALLIGLVVQHVIGIRSIGARALYHVVLPGFLACAAVELKGLSRLFQQRNSRCLVRFHVGVFYPLGVVHLPCRLDIRPDPHIIFLVLIQILDGHRQGIRVLYFDVFCICKVRRSGILDLIAVSLRFGLFPVQSHRRGRVPGPLGDDRSIQHYCCLLKVFFLQRLRLRTFFLILVFQLRLILRQGLLLFLCLCFLTAHFRRHCCDRLKHSHHHKHCDNQRAN